MNRSHICEAYGDEVSDELVWVKLSEGNIQALKTLFLRHYNHLFSYAVKISNDHSLAEDCIHDVFFRIWDRRQHLSEVASVKSYLWVSLRRELFKQMKGNEMEIVNDEVKDYAQQIRFNPEEFIIHNERKSERVVYLARALNQLSTRQREAIFLKYYNGMAYDEIEQIMSINYQTARNYVYSGIQVLKGYFDDQAERFIPHVLLILLFLLLV